MKKIYSVVIVVVLVLLVIWGFSKNKVSQTERPIVIGAVISLTGPAAQFGEYTQKGMELAVKEINKNGGIEGRPVRAVYEDDGTDPKRAVLAFNKLVGLDGAQGVVGGLWDFVAQPIMPLALTNKVPFITPTQFRIAGGFELNDQSFSMLTDFNQVIRELKPVLLRDEVKKVAVVHFKSVFGTEIEKTINQISKEIGKGAIIDEAYNSINTNDFKTTILKLKTQKVDTVFLDMVDKDTFNFLQRAKELSFTPKIITYVGSYDALDEDNQSLLEGATILNWDVSSKEFTSKFKAEYGIPPAKRANRAYDAVYILAEAIAKSDSQADVASYISSHQFTTMNGKVKFLSTHQVDFFSVEIDTFINGELIPVKN
jgi:branched-chain amino acid transport system substrate-binding protein